MTATNKQYSYPRVSAIWIDVHPIGGKPTNTPHASHAQSVYNIRPYVSYVVNAYQPFVSRWQIWMDPTAPVKSAPDSIPSTPTDRSTGLYPVFSLKPTNEAVSLSQASVD
jgi:hypothetical protein